MDPLLQYDHFRIVLQYNCPVHNLCYIHLVDWNHCQIQFIFAHHHLSLHYLCLYQGLFFFIVSPSPSLSAGDLFSSAQPNVKMNKSWYIS